MHNYSHPTPSDASISKNEPGPTQMPLLAFAAELIRLAEVVKHNIENGVAPIQTLSQLNAMEPIIGVLRVTGLKSVKDGMSELKEVTHAGYL